MTFFSFNAQPSCPPGRPAIQPGRIPNRSGHDHRGLSRPGGGLPHAQWTLGSALKTAGYQTFFTSKWHLGESDYALPNDQGYDEMKYGFGACRPTDLQQRELHAAAPVAQFCSQHARNRRDLLHGAISTRTPSPSKVLVGRAGQRNCQALGFDGLRGTQKIRVNLIVAKADLPAGVFMSLGIAICGSRDERQVGRHYTGAYHIGPV